MNGAIARPDYTSYLPPNLRSDSNRLYNQFVELYESLLAGKTGKPGQLIESRANLNSIPSSLLTLIAAEPDIRYDSAANRLVYTGKMSAIRREELELLASEAGIPLDTADFRNYVNAINDLFTLSWRNSPPRRIVDSWVDVDVGVINESLESLLNDGANRDIRYIPESHRIIYSGVMSAVRRDELIRMASWPAHPVSGTPLVPLVGDSLASYQDAINRLYEYALRREEDIPGLEVLLDNIQYFSNPLTTPTPLRDAATGDPGFFDDDFIPFLASWVALAVRQSWSEVKKRRLIKSIVPIYKKRGTLEGIRTMLEIFVDVPVYIIEDHGFVIAESSTVSVDSWVGGLAPHTFRVEIPYGFRDPGEAPEPFDFGLIRAITDTTREVLDLEKPAHTDYVAAYRFPGIVVGDYSTVSYDTLIWPPDQPFEVTSLGV